MLQVRYLLERFAEERERLAQAKENFQRSQALHASLDAGTRDMVAREQAYMLEKLEGDVAQSRKELLDFATNVLGLRLV